MQQESIEQIEGQLAIDVPESPRAIARFDGEDELLAYTEAMGRDAAKRQRELASLAATCTCGAQAKSNAQRAEEKLRPKAVKGHLHAPGCPAFKALPKKAAKISESEQVRRFSAGTLREKIAAKRKEGRL